MNLFKSTGFLDYSITDGKYRLVVDIDPEISRYYRSLIPLYCRPTPQRYAPHITVVRKEIPKNIDAWAKHQGKEIQFQYYNVIYKGVYYWWLDAVSSELENIREELGLPVMSEYTKPPDGRWTFHITLGNEKELP